MTRRKTAVGWFVIGATLIWGCAASEKKLTAVDFYQTANQEFEAGNYPQAIKDFRELLDQYPFSDYSEKAEIKIAHAHYKAEEYAEAIAAFNDFQRMHPTSPHLPMVYYLMGMSFMKQMSTIDRDQTKSENAHGWFKVAIDRYPESPFADKARHELVICREALADHELYVARFYFREGNIKAAENRVKGILELYPDTSVAAKALAKLARQWQKVGNKEAAQLGFSALLERFPDSPEAAELVENGASAKPDGNAFSKLMTELRRQFGRGEFMATAATHPSLAKPRRRSQGAPRGQGASSSPGFGFPTGGSRY